MFFPTSCNVWCFGICGRCHGVTLLCNVQICHEEWCWCPNITVCCDIRARREGVLCQFLRMQALSDLSQAQWCSTLRNATPTLASHPTKPVCLMEIIRKYAQICSVSCHQSNTITNYHIWWGISIYLAFFTQISRFSSLDTPLMQTSFGSLRMWIEIQRLVLCCLQTSDPFLCWQMIVIIRDLGWMRLAWGALIVLSPGIYSVRSWMSSFEKNIFKMP